MRFLGKTVRGGLRPPENFFSNFFEKIWEKNFEKFFEKSLGEKMFRGGVYPGRSGQASFSVRGAGSSAMQRYSVFTAAAVE